MDLEKLKKLATNATQDDDWIADEPPLYIRTLSDYENLEEDSDFITACSPKTILAMISELTAARTVVEAARFTANKHKKAMAKMRNKDGSIRCSYYGDTTLDNLVLKIEHYDKVKEKG